MNVMRKVPVGALLAAALAIAAGVFAQEHPEHPKGGGERGPAIGKESLAKAIRDYVKHDSELKGGYFLVYDTVAKKPLVLTLAKVHEDRLSKVAGDTYFACADLKEAKGDVYDLDIFMKGAMPDDLKPTEITIHKENAKPRYDWVEEGGLWKRRPKSQ